MSKHPVLPPVPDPQKLGFTGPPQSPAEETRMAVRTQLLKHRRSKVQQQQLHQTMVARATGAYRKSTERHSKPAQPPEPEFPPSMNSEIRKQRANYTFLRQCVESREVVPVQQQCLDSILTRIAPHLKQGPVQERLVQELCQEVKEDFLKTMVKHTVHTFLQPPQSDGSTSDKKSDSSTE